MKPEQLQPLFSLPVKILLGIKIRFIHYKINAITEKFEIYRGKIQ